ncbi:hypothetical protein Tco_1484596 [Tanacetum coccineum]
MNSKICILTYRSLKFSLMPPMYNAILDKYVESLELGKNRLAFVQGEMPKKMEDLGLFTLPCRLGDSKPFDTLDDLGSCVNIIPLCPNPYYVRKEFMDWHLPGEWEITSDAELNPFKDALVFRGMVEFLGALPINLKGNLLIDPDGEEFTKTFQSIPTSRKLSEKENPREINEWIIFMTPRRVTPSLATRLVK